MTREQDLKSQEDFKQLCRNNRFRLRMGPDRLPMAVTRSKKFPHDHLFEGFEDGRIGVYIQRPTIRHLNSALKRLALQGGLVAQKGDTDATLTFPPSKVFMAAKALCIVKAIPRKAVA